MSEKELITLSTRIGTLTVTILMTLVAGVNVMHWFQGSDKDLGSSNTQTLDASFLE